MLTLALARSPLFMIPLLGVLCGLSGCLTPPLAQQQQANVAAAPAPAPAARAPREFTHTSRELLATIPLGWNLGNSLDAPEGETAWGNPPVTAELLHAVARAGFGLVRIPVTWSLHTGPAPDFVIEPAWLSRVAEVVDYARDAGLYAIINVHHDGADGFAKVEWLRLTDESGALSEATDAAVQARFVAVWRQIAARFAGYGEELLFESMNEIHEGYGKPEPRYFELVNRYNQTFVDLVRASGGNNARRHLVVPGYNTNIDHTLAGFELPKDPTPDHLIVSAHYYDPYLFALQAKTHTWGRDSRGNDGWGQEDFVVQQLDKLKTRFIDRGVPVILGEYGACHQAGFEEYRRYYIEYVTKAAVDRGIVPVYWDNGAEGSGGEKFGLFNRTTYEPLHPGLLEAMMRAGKSSYTLNDVARPRP
jgi:endoglucanase